MEKEHVHKHLDILQGIISRMSSNSAACKNYCITLVGALLALDQIKDDKKLIFLALVPIIAFAFLDAYYLYLETFFRTSYNTFVEKWQTAEITKTDLFVVGSPETGRKGLKESLYQFKSLSISMFYIFLFAVVLVLIAYNYCHSQCQAMVCPHTH